MLLTTKSMETQTTSKIFQTVFVITHDRLVNQLVQAQFVIILGFIGNSRKRFKLKQNLRWVTHPFVAVYLKTIA